MTNMETKSSDLELITSVLIEATKNVEEIYFQLPVAGQEEPQFRERVYCYELYHQMRLRWPNVPYRITGEIDKSGHPWIYRGPLDYSKPDFTIHIPGRMADNLLVVEVKAINPTDKQIVVDIRKLTGFCRTADYFAAYYLIYGFTENEAHKFSSRCKTLAAGDGEIDLSRIKLFNHAKPMSPASEIAWPI
jgi:hypothetical protein